MSSDSTPPSVGECIKALRERAGLTLQTLADRTGYTSALLNQVENHLVSPPLGSLATLAHALGVSIGELWGEQARDPFALVRQGDRRQVSRFASKEGVSYGYAYQSLGFGKKNRHLEPFLVTLEPPTVASRRASMHGGEEFLFVLSGRMEVTLADHSDVLEPGDSIQYDASLPHFVRCVGEEPAQILAVIWSPEE